MFLRSESATVMQIVDCLKEISRTQLKRYRTILSTNVKPIPIWVPEQVFF